MFTQYCLRFTIAYRKQRIKVHAVVSDEKHIFAKKAKFGYDLL